MKAARIIPPEDLDEFLAMAATAWDKVLRDLDRYPVLRPWLIPEASNARAAIAAELEEQFGVTHEAAKAIALDTIPVPAHNLQ